MNLATLELMDYRQKPKQYFTETLERVLTYLQSIGVAVSFVPALPSLASASFNGVSIKFIDTINREVALYTTLHIFGHIIQGSTNTGMPGYTESGKLPTGRLPEMQMLFLKLKEQEASEFGLGLLHQLGVTDLDQWVSDVWAWDWQYIDGIYSGEVAVNPALGFDYAQIPFGQTRLRPRPVPTFTPKQFPIQMVI